MSRSQWPCLVRSGLRRRAVAQLATFGLRIGFRARTVLCAERRAICVARVSAESALPEFPGVAPSLLACGRMVQPVRFAFIAFIAISTVASKASAEPLSPSCRTGLVLGVSDEEANDVVGAVCNAAKRRGTTGMVRVSVLAAGPKFRVGVARLVDTKDVEQTAHAEAATIAEATRIAPTVLEALDAPTPAVAPTPVHAPAPASAPEGMESVVRVEPIPPPTQEQPKSALETKAGPPAAWLGVHGSSGIAGGGAGLGGGAAIGVDHRSAQGFIDYSNSSGSPKGENFQHQMLTIGARLKLSQAALKPVIGGGWSYVDYERGEGIGKTSGQGIGVFGEAGVIYALQKHQILAVARWNIGLFEERTTRPYSYTTYDGRQVDSVTTSSGSGGLSSSFALMAGYGYVFR